MEIRLHTLVGAFTTANLQLVASSVFFVPDQAIKTSVTLPAKVALGAELKALPVRLTLDAELTFWSSFDSFRIATNCPDELQPLVEIGGNRRPVPDSTA